MQVRIIQWAITISMVVVAVVHLLRPDLKVDAITITALVIAALPWLAPLVQELELPGGLKVKFQDLLVAKVKAEEAGLLASPTEAGALPEYSFLLVADTDPTLALAGLRIEIEKRLRLMAESHGLHVRPGVGSLLRELSRAQVLTSEEQNVLADLVHLLNSAVHGAAVDEQAAEWAIDVGPRLLRSLDMRIRDESRLQGYLQ
jgi:hypothetical protein